MKQCIECGSTSLHNILDTIEINQDDKTYVVENVPAIKCSNCNEIYHSAESSQFIDHQLEIFKAEGFENKLTEIRKQKKLTQEDLGQLLGGLTKQRVSQIEKDDNLDVKTMIRVANALNEPLPVLFKFNRVVQKNNKFYLEN